MRLNECIPFLFFEYVIHWSHSLFYWIVHIVHPVSFSFCSTHWWKVLLLNQIQVHLVFHPKYILWHLVYILGQHLHQTLICILGNLSEALSEGVKWVQCVSEANCVIHSLKPHLKMVRNTYDHMTCKCER